MTKPARGECPACGEEKALQANGTMRYHLGRPGRAYRSVCDGYGTLPRRLANPHEAAIVALRDRAVVERRQNPMVMTSWAAYLTAAEYLESLTAPTEAVGEP